MHESDLKLISEPASESVELAGPKTGVAMQEFRDRVAVVTGGAGGVGKALARAFVGEGMKVVIADVEERALKVTTEELGAGVMGVVTDVSDASSVQALAERVFDAHGACHIL